MYGFGAAASGEDHVTPEISEQFHQALKHAWQAVSMDNINTLVDTVDFVWNVIRSHTTERSRPQKLETVKRAIAALSKCGLGEGIGGRLGSVRGQASVPSDAGRAAKAAAVEARALARYQGAAPGSGLGRRSGGCRLRRPLLRVPKPRKLRNL
eukprot:4816826-Alexandrium_andersonii.AAC.1